MSHGWFVNMRKRAGIVSRAPTNVRVFPDNAGSIAYAFMQEAQALVKDKDIIRDNIINMDQVPRYFESTQRKTFALRGQKRILLRKSTGHKRFTATFAITASGKLFPPHLLFSKLKRPPKVVSGCIVAVNQTGMWSVPLLKDWINEVVCKRPETALYRQETLLMFDSYGCHIKLLEDSDYMDMLKRKKVNHVLINIFI